VGKGALRGLDTRARDTPVAARARAPPARGWARGSYLETRTNSETKHPTSRGALLGRPPQAPVARNARPAPLPLALVSKLVLPVGVPLAGEPLAVLAGPAGGGYIRSSTMDRSKHALSTASGVLPGGILCAIRLRKNRYKISPQGVYPPSHPAFQPRKQSIDTPPFPVRYALRLSKARDRPRNITNLLLAHSHVVKRIRHVRVL